MRTPSATQVDIGGRPRHPLMLRGLSQRELAQRAGELEAEGDEFAGGGVDAVEGPPRAGADEPAVATKARPRKAIRDARAFQS